MARIPAVLFALAIFIAGFYAGNRFADEERVAVGQAVAAAPARAQSSQQDSLQDTEAERARLRDQLRLARREISELESWNQALARQIDRLDLPLPASTTYPELLQRVERLPPELVAQQLARMFDQTYLERVEDPNALASELIEIALSDEEPDDETRVQIEFSLSPVNGLRQFTSLQQIDRGDRVFAHFVTSHDLPNLILRWQHRDSGEILQFGPLQLSRDRGSSRSLKPSGGWKTGYYQVTLFDLDNERQLVGGKLFQIASVNPDDQQAEESTVDRDVIEDLISSGQAVPKSF